MLIPDRSKVDISEEFGAVDRVDREPARRISPAG
jgi:hypothetical protein